MTDTITIARDEYDRLRDAADTLGDLRVYDRARGRLDAGEDELVPADFARRLIEGESPLRVYRQLRGPTQSALAQMSRVNRVQIAEVEAGRNKGSVDTVKRLAGALGVAVDDLV